MQLSLNRCLRLHLFYPIKKLFVRVSMKRDYKGPALRTSLCQSKGIKANKHLECVFNTMGGTCSDYGQQVTL